MMVYFTGNTGMSFQILFVFIIFFQQDNDTDQVYFCFRDKLNEGKQEVEIEYIKQEKGISLYGFSFQIYCRYRNINKVK